MENSAGSAEAEMEIIRESAEYAMNRLKETFTSLAQHSVSRGGLKDLINAGTTILEIVDGIVSQIGLIPTILTTIFGIMSAKKNVQTGFFNATLNPSSKFGFGLNFMGAQIGKDWSKQRTVLKAEKAAIKAEMNEYKTAISSLWDGLKTGKQDSESFKNAYTKAMSSSSAAVQEFAEKAKSGTATVQDLDRATASLGKTSASAQRAVKILNTAISMISTALISAAINTVISGLNKMFNWAKENKEKANEYADEVKNIETRIGEVNEQLVTTQKRINELKAIENPTIIEQEELDKLKKTNEELERMLKILQAEQQDKANQAAEKAVEWWRTVSGIDVNYLDAQDWFSIIPRSFGNISSLINNETRAQYQNAILEYKSTQEEILKLQEELSKATDKSYIEKLKNQIDELNVKLKKNASIAEKNYATYATKMEQLNPDIPEQKDIIDTIKYINGVWEEYSGKNIVKSNLVDILNNYKFTEVKDQLVSLWKQGKLTEEEFNKLSETTVDGLEEFKQTLKDNGYEDFAEIIRALSGYFKDIVKDVDEAADGVKEFKEQLEKLQEKIDNIVSKQEKLAESFKKIGLGAKLSAKEAYDLVKEVPEIAKYLEENGKEFTISQEGYREANKELYKELKDNIAKDYVESKEQRQALNEIKSLFDEQAKFIEENGKPLLSLQQKYGKLIDEYKEKYKVTDDDALGKNIDETLKKVNDNYEGLSVISQLINDMFDERQLAVDSINEGFNRGKEEIDTFNKNIQTIDSAIKSLNEETLLSYDEMNALIELSPELQDSFIQQEHGYSIAISALEDLRKQSYETRNQYIDDLISEAKAEMQAAEETKKANQLKCGYVNEYGEYIAGTLSGIENAVEKLAAEEQVAIADAQIEALKQIVQKLEGLRGDITYDDDKKDEKSLSDIMQEQIDYYKMLISAVEAVKNKYTEAIDSEIDALNDSKDALKETNDERQRELDLIEARNNLENAKKRKVWVYSEANGFQQVQDEKAVKEAEEKYRDAIQEVQEAAIDKQIDALEKKKETLENQVKDLTELENNIEDSKTITQALSALGLSEEKDLLNLSDSVKQGIKEGLAEAILTKDQEDNKDNDKYVPVNLDDVLSHLGATVTAEDIKSLNLITKDDFNNAVQDFATSMKEYQDANVSNVINNSGGMVISPTFNINGVTDPNEVAKVVNSEMTNLFTKINNSIK